MTNFRKAVKDLLREMLCKSKESDCDSVNRFFHQQPYVVGDFPTRNTWVS